MSDGKQNLINSCSFIIEFTVKLRWLKLVGTICASSSHQWVRAIPGLTIFKGVHMCVMFTMDTMFLWIKMLSARDICHLCPRKS